MTEFSDKQLEALGSEAPRICITAGPGSGKTRVLVERVRRRVLDGKIDLARTLAITFTENAAAEMKDRLAKAFEESGRGDLREALENARISTIHAFCARLLRENAIQAGVDPRFQVLDELQAGLLRARALDVALEKVTSERPDDFLELTRHFRGATYRDHLLGLHARIRSLGGDPSDAAALLAPPDACADAGAALARDEAPVERHRELVAGVIAAVQAAYAEMKRAIPALDFGDLEEATANMLRRDPELARQLSRRFDEVLVDEQQDTNPLQNQVIGRLAAETRLFVVGDIAQSIYGFRGARPRAPQGFAEQSERAAQARGAHELRRDYRSRPEIINAINCHFASLFQATGTPFTRLEAGQAFAEKDVPSVELSLVGAGKMDEARGVEARHLARRIHELIGKKQLRVTNRKSEKFGESLGYGDVAFLFRASGDMYRYEWALEDYGIPYFSETGRGFYRAREVRDVLAFLRALDNSRDEVAVAAVLRSPMFGVSDDALYLLADYAHANRGVLGEVLDEAGAIPGIPAADAARIAAFRALLDRLRAERPWRPLRDLVREIVRATGYETALLIQFNGRRRAANLHKLAELAGSLEAGGFGSLKDVITAMEEFRYQEVREGEAQLDTASEGAVRLMTMHAAKGLEFPLVVLPDLSRGARPDRDVLKYHPRYGIAAKFDFAGKPEATALFESVREEEKQEEAAERLRVLFVAMTRAEEHLILSGCLKESKKGFSAPLALGEICRTCGVSSPMELDGQPRIITVGRREQAAETFQLSVLATSTDPGEPPQYAFGPVARREQLALEAGASLSIPVPPGAQAQAAALLAETRKPAPACDSGEFLATVTDVLKFHHCPRRYYLGYYLGYPEGEKKAFPVRAGEPEEPEEDGAPDDDNDYERWELGRAVHAVLARGREALSEVPGPMREEVQRLAEGFWSAAADDWARRVSGSSEVRRELSLIASLKAIASLDDRFLRGTLDVLTFENARPALLLDYKANDIGAAEVERETAHYRIQMVLYALLVQAAFGQPPAEAVLYFLAPGIARSIDLTPAALEEARSLLCSFFEAQKRLSFPQVAADHCYRCPYQGSLCRPS
jgi:ATP-dependent exoDNAse (exonuclease V) beta subunit